MIKKLQRLKAKRGFTMVELIIVIAVIGVMIGVLLAAADTQREKRAEANSAASDLYSALQAEFTGFQMFDGPLTMELNRQYNSADKPSLPGNGNYAGIKYYPAVGGNYPFEGAWLAGETHKNGYPKEAALYLKFHTTGGLLREVNYANDFSYLLGMETAVGNGNPDAELCRVLQQEMRDRIQYRDGYYYARISYKPPMDYGSGLTKADYRNTSVKVDWVAFCNSEITSDSDTYTFKSQNMNNNGTVCGVHTTTEYSTIGTTGTSLMDAAA